MKRLVANDPPLGMTERDMTRCSLLRLPLLACASFNTKKAVHGDAAQGDEKQRSMPCAARPCCGRDDAWLFGRLERVFTDE